MDRSKSKPAFYARKADPTTKFKNDFWRRSRKPISARSSPNLLAFMVMALASLNAGAEVPRMWKVSSPSDKRGTVLYILGISHVGTPLEYDSYLEKKVIPAFLAADVFHFEDGGPLPANEQPACAQPLRNPENIATLQRAREMVGRAAVGFFRGLAQLLPMPGARKESTILGNAANYTRELSEFSVVEDLRLQYLYLASQNLNLKPPDVFYQPVVSYLHGLRPEIQVKSMDGPKDLVEAYCSAGEIRAQIIDLYMNNYDIDHAAEQDSDTSFSTTKKLNEKLLGVLTGLPNKTDVNESAFTCSRTGFWETRMNSLMDGQIHFLALGAGHLFPSSGPTASCPGLLNDLRRSGFVVELIR